jgi:hypothetical protein
MRFSFRVVQFALVILLLAVAAHAQTPTSGAMLTINGNVGNTAVNILIYDSQIHSGTVHPVPTGGGSNCGAGDQAIPTDAYVLQGGSATGCDPGDSFEVTDNNGNAVHQTYGLTDITLSAGPGSPALPGTGFEIKTQYLCSGVQSVGGNCNFGEVPLCNTSRTICANPDTGFLTVTNNTGEVFTGMITLQGNSLIQGGSYCAQNGIAFDNWPSGLSFVGQEVAEEPSSVTLALGTMGDAVGLADSSNCGGFNFDQKQPIASGQKTTFLFGNDKLSFTPASVNPGDEILVRPVPEPAGLGIVSAGSPVGAGLHCISVADFAAQGNPVCPELQTKCVNTLAQYSNEDGTCTDGESFVWTGEFDARLDPNAGYPPVQVPNSNPAVFLPEVGGVHFLGLPAAQCPQNTFSEELTVSYTGDNINDLPVHGGGGHGLNCFLTAYDTTAQPVAPGQTVFAFDGFKPPVKNSDAMIVLNPLFVPETLRFQVFNGAGGPAIKNLHWCPDPTNSTSPTGCGTAKWPIAKPWAAFSQIPLNAPGCPAANFSQGPIFGPLVNLGNGNYSFYWIPLLFKDDGCATVQVQLSFGTVVRPANFLYP